MEEIIAKIVEKYEEIMLKAIFESIDGDNDYVYFYTNVESIDDEMFSGAIWYEYSNEDTDGERVNLKKIRTMLRGQKIETTDQLRSALSNDIKDFKA